MCRLLQPGAVPSESPRFDHGGAIRFDVVGCVPVGAEAEKQGG